MTKIYFATTLQDIDLSKRFANNAGAPKWLADEDACLAAKIEARNVRLVAQLSAGYPGLILDKDSLEPEDYADERLGQPAVLARYQRARILDGDWPHGAIRIAIFDGQIELTVCPDLATQENLQAFRQDYAALLSELCAASEMTPLQIDNSPNDDIAAVVQSLLDKAAPRIRQLAHRARTDALLRACAIPGIVLSGILAIALAMGLLGQARDEGRLAAGVDPAAEFTFVTEYQRPIIHHFGFMPEFSLQGHIRDQTTSFALKVFRDEYLRSGPGAPYSVVATDDPETPFILRKRYENALPVISPFGLSYAWSALLAILPIFLWYRLFLHPLRRAHPDMRPLVLRRIGIRAVLLGVSCLALPVLLAVVR